MPSTESRQRAWTPVVVPLGDAVPEMRQPATSPTVRSALWAAWGDALGFPTELTRDEAQVQRRLDTVFVESTGEWRRRVGGRNGPTIPLPAGTYSDDTQLRLAVGRSIRAADRFDVEAFSKIELPVFLSYALGAGRGTKAAANSLQRRAVRWYSNFFSTPTASYVSGGGNGAAMRIQPHVWASPGYRPDDYIRNVVRDTVTTHGHPRALVGACLHALCLGTTLRESAIPEPQRWPGMVRYLERLAEIVKTDETLSERWLPRWERESGESWTDALQKALDETEGQLGAATRLASAKSSGDAYSELAAEIGGLAPETRGSGVVSAVLALWLAYANRDAPSTAPIAAANLLGSDTDTIASMAGALVGVIAGSDPPGQLADRELLIEEALRLEHVHDRLPTESFPHPDVLSWQPPRTLSDAVGLADGRVLIAGLGAAVEDGEIYVGSGRDPGVWQWMRLEFGQRVLIKRRRELAALPDYARPRRRPVQPLQPEIPLDRPEPQTLPDAVEDAVVLLVKNDFESELMSRLLRHFAMQEHGVTKAALFGGLVADALIRDRGLQAVVSDDPMPALTGDEPAKRRSATSS